MTLVKVAISNKETKEKLGVSRKTLLRWMESNPAIRETDRGGRTRYALVPESMLKGYTGKPVPIAPGKMEEDGTGADALEQALREKGIEEALLAAVLAKQKRMVLEGQIVAPAELEKREQTSRAEQQAVAAQGAELGELEKVLDEQRDDLDKERTELTERWNGIVDAHKLCVADLDALRGYHNELMEAGKGDKIDVPWLGLSDDFYEGRIGIGKPPKKRKRAKAKKVAVEQ